MLLKSPASSAFFLRIGTGSQLPLRTDVYMPPQGWCDAICNLRDACTVGGQLTYCEGEAQASPWARFSAVPDGGPIGLIAGYAVGCNKDPLGGGGARAAPGVAALCGAAACTTWTA